MDELKWYVRDVLRGLAGPSPGSTPTKAAFGQSPKKMDAPPPEFCVGPWKDFFFCAVKPSPSHQTRAEAEPAIEFLFGKNLFHKSA